TLAADTHTIPGAPEACRSVFSSVACQGVLHLCMGLVATQGEGVTNLAVIARRPVVHPPGLCQPAAFMVQLCLSGRDTLTVFQVAQKGCASIKENMSILAFAVAFPFENPAAQINKVVVDSLADPVGTIAHHFLPVPQGIG